MIPAEVAIYKAVKTKDPSLVKRIYLIWGSWYSRPGYDLAASTRFVWGLHYIQTDVPLDTLEWIGVYADLGEIDKIDFTIPHPLRYTD